jgi:hypothetical protein
MYSIDTEATNMITSSGTNRKPYLDLEMDEEGHPILPDPSEWPKKGMEKKALIRSYVAVAYSQSQIFNLGYSRD